ncbi:hypothetical protein ACH5RR_008989 [Cinchona calisaya]|uniref:FBD domain-containing protein n=1 Tax=Cinchona calisaya TaxID=153742 RepID=A0ABD3AGR6_9GENT
MLPLRSNEHASRLQMKLDVEKLFWHKCLKKVKIFKFEGAPIELQLVKCVLKSAILVDNLTIIRRGQLFLGNGEWEEYRIQPKVTRDQVRKRLIGHLPFFTRLTVL